MLKRFLSCVDKNQRYDFFSKTGVDEWDKSELSTVCGILSIDTDEEKTEAELYRLILAELSARMETDA